jgi:hypothetical protein
MRHKLLKLRTDWELRTNKATRGTVPYKQALNVGIIFTVEDKQKHDCVKDFIKKLEHDGKKVQVIEFLPENKENFEFKFDFFTENDFSIWGKITAQNALRFSDAPFDFVLCRYHAQSTDTLPARARQGQVPCWKILGRRPSIF